ncbi:MAG: sigma 54-interacting transcriptional regulator [Candidatus Hinthialibacter antarcticus]|nr:sigma 54-interacting transcriptional regulator [Candidatus Hinthialibacter antarcticus]
MKGKPKASTVLNGVHIAFLARRTKAEKQLVENLTQAGCKVSHETDLKDLLFVVSQAPADALFIDLSYCQSFQDEKDRKVTMIDSLGDEMIVMSNQSDISDAARWARVFKGYCLATPADAAEAVILLERVMDAGLLKRRLSRYETMDSSLEQFGSFIVKSPEMRDVIRLARILTDRDDCILFSGGVGVGKERLARTIHENSKRKHGPFYSINCRSFSGEELALELFGQADTGKGSTDKTGSLLEQASGGSLFLDEISMIPPSVQGKLERLASKGSFTPANSRASTKSDIRLFSATSQPLDELVASGGFSEELYFHLSRFVLHLPALHRRVEDIPILTKTILERMARERGEEPLLVTEETLRLLMDYQWPGNLRELENVLDFASLVAGKGPIDPKHLPKQFNDDVGSLFVGVTSDELPPMSEIERRYILKVMDAVNGNKVKAAVILDINRATLHRKLQIYENMRRTEIA